MATYICMLFQQGSTQQTLAKCAQPHILLTVLSGCWRQAMLINNVCSATPTLHAQVCRPADKRLQY